MATTHLTKNYRPRIVFNESYGIEHPINAGYVSSLASYMMTRVRSTARPYHKKHIGVKDNGTKGKLVTITKEQMEQKIRDTKGKSPDGTSIYFGPVGYLSNPTKAIELGFMTAEENSRKPSPDRIDSNLKEYSNENLQITTKKYNLGKSNDDSTSVVVNAKIEVGKVNITLEGVTPQYLAAYTQSLAA
jgi:hypothetical protein